MRVEKSIRTNKATMTPISVILWGNGFRAWGVKPNGNQEEIAYGWWNGCEWCGDYEEKIQEIIENEGTLEACRFAMEHLNYCDEGYLCDECSKDHDAERNDEELDLPF